MVPIAPRYDRRILELARTLDERAESMAETSRRVGAVAVEMGLYKPSYSHLRRFIREYRDEEDAERRRREEILRILGEVYLDTLRSRVVNAYDVAERIREAGK